MVFTRSKRRYSTSVRRNSVVVPAVQRRRLSYAPTIQRASRAEAKYFDQSYAETDVSATISGSLAETNTYGLFCPTQGDAKNNRDGRKATIKGLSIRGVVRTNGASFSQPDNADFVVKIMVVQDKQTNGAQMSPTDLMTDKQELSFRNLDHIERFQVLAQKVIEIGMDSISSQDGTNFKAAGQSKYFEINKDLNIPVYFDASTGAVTDITNSSIHVLAVTGQDVVGAPDCKLRYESRVKFEA